MMNPVYTGTLVASNLLFSIIMLTADEGIEWKTENFNIIAPVAILINLIFLVDMVANFIVLGPKNVWKARKPVFLELLLQVFMVLFFIFYIDSNFGFSKFGFFSVLALIFMIRNLRILHYLSEFEPARLISQTLMHIKKPILGKFLFIYLVFYMYAQIGMLAFSGLLTDKTFIESGAPSFYYLMNFNDFGSSLVTLFH